MGTWAGHRSTSTPERELGHTLQVRHDTRMRIWRPAMRLRTVGVSAVSFFLQGFTCLVRTQDRLDRLSGHKRAGYPRGP